MTFTISYPAYTAPSPLSICVDGLQAGFRFLKRYSDTTLKVAVFGFDIAFLTAKSAPNTLKNLATSSLVALNGLSILSLIYNLDWTKKDAQDALFCAKQKHRQLALAASLNVAQSVNDAALIALSTLAAVDGQLGFVETQTAIYRKTLVWSLSSAVSNFLLSMIDFKISKEMHQELENEIPAETKQIILQLLAGNAVDATLEQRKLVSALRFSMDKDTLEELLSLLERQGVTDEEHLFSIIKKNIATQVEITLSTRIILLFAGLIMLGVEKYYTPDSLAAALINLSFSTSWAVQTIREKYHEIKQRAAMQTPPVPSLV